MGKPEGNSGYPNYYRKSDRKAGINYTGAIRRIVVLERQLKAHKQRSDERIRDSRDRLVALDLRVQELESSVELLVLGRTTRRKS